MEGSGCFCVIGEVAQHRGLGWRGGSKPCCSEHTLEIWRISSVGTRVIVMLKLNSDSDID